jgi:hypothetical protein
MDDQRKKIIINEIEYWKKSLLLPEHYCNFLLTLYSEGNHPIKEDSSIRQKPKSHYFGVLLLLLAITSVFVIYFTELSFILQISIYITYFICGCFLIKYFFKKGLLSHLSFIFSALVSLLVSIEFISQIFPENSLILYIALLFNCLVWIFVGIKFKIIYFTISGLLGVLTIIFFIFI